MSRWQCPRLRGPAVQTMPGSRAGSRAGSFTSARPNGARGRQTGNGPGARATLGEVGTRPPDLQRHSCPRPSLASKTKATHSDIREGCRQQEPAWWHRPLPGFLQQV